MGNRLDLHEIFCNILGSRQVYFDPPESLKISYPAIIYELDDVNALRADDHGYLLNRRYQVKYISRDPDNTVIDDLLRLQYCSFDRRFATDNLYHDCFDIYY